MMKSLALIIAAMTLNVCANVSASANGIESRAYTCVGLQSFVAAHGFVFISQATFGDFVVGNRSFCGGGDILQTRSVATSDTPECLVNYCVSREMGTQGGGGRDGGM
jgi:hypothetical protein